MPLSLAPRVRRKRSCFPSLFCCLILAWAVIMVCFNIARLLMLPGFFVRNERVGVIKPPRPPNYYEILGVDPLVDDKTLRQMRKQFGLEYHPDKVKGDSLEALENYVTMNEAFNTLTNGRLRCEYDKAHNIKGKWATQTCRDAFREEYRQMYREELKRTYEKQYGQKQRAAKKKSIPKPSAPDDEQVKVKVKVEVEQPVVTEIKKQTSREAGSKSGLKTEGKPAASKPEVRWGVPLVTVEVEPEPEIRVVGTVRSAVARVWTDGIVRAWFVAKDTVAEYSEPMFEFLGSFFNVIFGVARVHE